MQRNAPSQRNRGQGLVEYGLIVGLIAIIVIALFVALGPAIRDMFSQPESQTSDEISADTTPVTPLGSDTE